MQADTPSARDLERPAPTRPGLPGSESDAGTGCVASNSSERPSARQLADGRPRGIGECLQRWLELALVFAIFATSATCRSPVPGVNEPHFLTKAKHFWNPDWCPRDIFLNSANAHAVYLFLSGALTRVFTLEQTAWIGRMLVWACLALGWTRLVRSLSPKPWVAVWSACLYVTIAACGSFSGEWIVGGVEAKGFAYAALLAGLANAGERNWFRCALWTGVATSLHPVVGVWGTLSVLTAGISVSWPRVEVDWRRALGICGIWLLCAAPGLIPAILMVLEPVSATVKQRAAEIQVFERLGHHLNPQTFSVAKNAYGFILLIAFAGLRFALTTSPGIMLRRVILVAILIAELGLLLGWTTQPASLMKFYFFRLADGLVPIVVAIACVVWLSQWARSRFQDSARFRTAGGLISASVLFAGLLIPVPDRGPQKLAAGEIAAWRDVCAWMRQSTPPDAVFLTPSYAYAFKWYAERAEYAVFKDCPQDASSLIEWHRRLRWVRAWRLKYSDSGYPAESLQELRAETGVEYLVARHSVVTSVRPIYENESFAIYQALDRTAGD